MSYFNNNERWYEHTDLNGNKYYDHIPESGEGLSFSGFLWCMLVCIACGLCIGGLLFGVVRSLFTGSLSDFLEGMLMVLIGAAIFYFSRKK